MTMNPEKPAATITRPDATSIAVGDVLFTRETPLTRAHLVAYAGASGDRNPIHYDDVFAREVGLDGVIAHGMLTLGIAGSAAADWAGDPAAVASLEARFTRQVLVPNPGAALLTVTGKAGAVEVLDDGSTSVRVDLAVAGPEGKAVLAKARAFAVLAAPAH